MRSLAAALLVFVTLACEAQDAPPAQPAEPAKPAAQVPPPPPPGPTREQILAKGRDMAVLGGCNHCHTPWMFDQELKMPVPDMSKMLSGHPVGAPKPQGKVGKHDIGLIGPTFTSFALPFGTVYAANLTPDKDTGLGSWTAEQFKKALRGGKHAGQGPRAILPPMPWLDIGSATDADLDALFAYLQSIPPIANKVPDPEVPAPVVEGITKSFEALQAKLAAMPKPPHQEGPAGRGGYLVHYAGCNHCHTPWMFDKELHMPVPDMSKMLSGHPAKGPAPEGKPGKGDIGLIGPSFTSFAMPFGTVYAANLTPHETGLASWTEETFVSAMRNVKHWGNAERAILPPMPAMDYGQLPDEDLKAIFAYLKSIPPIDNRVPEHKVPPPAIKAITASFEKLKAKMAAAKGAPAPAAAAAPAAPAPAANAPAAPQK